MYRKVILLLLLGYFAGALNITLAQEPSSPAQATSDPNVIERSAVVVAIPNDGEFYLAKVRVAETDLPEKLEQAFRDTPRDERIAYIKASTLVSYGTIVSLIGVMGKVGIDRVGLVADKKKNPDSGRALPYTQTVNKSSSSVAVTSAVINIYVRNKTHLKLNSKTMGLSSLSRRLQRMLAGRSNKTVFIVAPSKMSYGDVVKVIDLAKGAGAQPIGLQVAQLK